MIDISTLNINATVNTAAMERSFSEYERLGAVFPIAISWLCDPERLAALIEVKTVQPGDGKIYFELQPTDFLVGFISALQMAEHAT